MKHQVHIDIELSREELMAALKREIWAEFERLNPRGQSPSFNKSNDAICLKLMNSYNDLVDSLKCGVKF